MSGVLRFAWRDLCAGGRSLWLFAACLALGVALVAASGGVVNTVRDGLAADARALFGGDLVVRHRAPLGAAELDWMHARGEVSVLRRFRSMLLTEDGRAQLVEVQSHDANYPLYGSVRLAPDLALRDAVAAEGGVWGAALDPALAARLDVGVGDRLQLGDLTLTVRALVERQPDRGLRADWRGPPLLVSADAVAESGLLGPGSVVAHRYRVRTGQSPSDWRDDFAAAFPDGDWEVRTVTERSERVGEVLGQVASALLVIALSALFIGGLGVFNSVQAYLRNRLGTMATLRALGLRDGRLARLYLLQILVLAIAASTTGALTGGALALIGLQFAADRLPVAATLTPLAAPLAQAWAFGVLTALLFALPALGRALSIAPAALFREVDAERARTPRRYWMLTGGCGAGLVALILAVIPETAFGVGFVLATMTVVALLEGGVRGLRGMAGRVLAGRRNGGGFTLRLALSSLARSGSPLRPLLLSLGTALTLLVASTLVVATLLKAINDTIPERAPALVFYDVPAAETDRFRDLMGESSSLEQLDLAPLVLGRLARVNGEVLRESTDPARALEARNEHKMSYLLDNFDNVVIDRGAWWPDDHDGPTLVAMEDREADQLGLAVGDRLRFDIGADAVDAELVAIYAQKRFQSRMWLEAIFSDGALDPYIARYVGAAYMDAGEATQAQNRIAAVMPGVATLRTADVLDEARRLLARAGAGLAVIGAVTLLASLLVLVSVVAASRVRQIYDAGVLHALGARVSLVRRALQLEYVLLGALTTLFATIAGTVIAAGFIHWRLELDVASPWWTGALTAVAVSTLSLGLGARYLLGQLRHAPARLLRAGG